MTRAVLPQMRRQRAGHDLNFSSVGGFQSFAGYGLYCSTKFAVEGLSEALHAELAPLGIRVTVVEPGYFRTDFLDASSIVESETRIADYDATAGATREHGKAHSGKQLGNPARLAEAMLTLVRSENPPLRLQIGSDAIEAIDARLDFVRQELKAWRALTTSTDFELVER